MFNNANLKELPSLIAKGKRKGNVVKFLIKDSEGRDIYASNEYAKERGKIMIECHYFIDKNGTILEVRPPEYPSEYINRIFSDYLLVVEVEGLFTWENIDQLQYNSIMQLAKFLKEKYRQFKGFISLKDEVLNESTPGPNFPILEINESVKNMERYSLQDPDESVIYKPIRNNIKLTSPYTMNDEVLVLKYKLEKLGMDVITNNVYDEDTAGIINSIKYLYGMKTDSICTPEVISIIDNIITSRINNSKYKIKPKFKRILHYTEPNLKGDDVSVIQEKLYLAGFYSSNINGIYNKETERAVAEFQKSINYRGDLVGVIDSIIWKKIIAIKNYTFSRMLYLDTPNMEGSDIATLQIQLVNLGYECDINGIFDSKTDEAIKKFQNAKGISSDGVVTESVFNSIMESE